MFYVVWLNKNNNTYYYRKVKGTYKNYYIGYENQYNHEIIVIIREELKTQGNWKKMFLKRFIIFLEKKYRKL